jgi:hypothetical protein
MCWSFGSLLCVLSGEQTAKPVQAPRQRPDDQQRADGQREREEVEQSWLVLSFTGLGGTVSAGYLRLSHLRIPVCIKLLTLRNNQLPQFFCGYSPFAPQPVAQEKTERLGVRFFGGLSYWPGRGVRPYLGAVWRPDNRKRTAGIGGALVLVILLLILAAML